MQAVILAGGRGTRLGALSAHTPKAMMPVGGRPLLDYSLRLLQRHGVQEVVICTGHLADKIESYVKNGEDWRLRVRYSVEPSPMGTAGCLRAIQPMLGDDFLVMYADVLMDVDLHALVQAHRSWDADATLVVHPSSHPHDSDLVEMDPVTCQIRAIHKKPHPPHIWLNNLASAALYVLKPKLIGILPAGEKADCMHDLFPRALEQGYRLFGHRTTEYLKDAGTPDRLEEVERDSRTGRFPISAPNCQRRAVFLDRDGVINREVNLLSHPDQLELLPGAAEGIRRLNQAGFLTFVVTNQPVVARGLCNEEQLRIIHAKLETLLGAEGAYLDAIYYCPHHPNGGFDGENSAYKIPCQCRKPATGLIEAAISKFKINRRESFFVGDTTTDLQTGCNAGLTTVLVQTGYGGNDKKYSVAPDHSARDLRAAADWMLTCDPLLAGSNSA